MRARNVERWASRVLRGRARNAQRTTHNAQRASQAGAALLTAAMGVRVVKHGNRSISSRSGSADLLECLGLPQPLDEQRSGECLAAMDKEPKQGMSPHLATYPVSVDNGRVTLHLAGPA